MRSIKLQPVWHRSSLSVKKTPVYCLNGQTPFSSIILGISPCWGKPPARPNRRQVKQTLPSPQGDRKGLSPSSQPSPPLQRLRAVSESHRIFVRAGWAWWGGGTLAVALGGVGWPLPCLSGRTQSPSRCDTFPLVQHTNLTPIGQASS